jgi:hypothetical protein
MTGENGTIVLQAMVDDTEQSAVRRAAEQLEGSLTTAAERPIAVRCVFSSSGDALDEMAENPIIIASLLPEVSRYNEPWPDVDRRLRARSEALSKKDGAVIFLCTVLRHVAHCENTDETRLKLIRIRRLNLLAAELSRQFGAHVIDIDRNLADIGARALETDYRLKGPYASGVAARGIALAIVSTGLDSYVSFEVQDTAKLLVAELDLALPVPLTATPDIVRPNVLSLGAGRRKQVVATVVDTDNENHATWLVKLILTRQFGVRDAFAKLRGSIARRGLRASAAMVLAAVRQALVSRTGMGG